MKHKSKDSKLRAILYYQKFFVVHRELSVGLVSLKIAICFQKIIKCI